VQYAKVQSMLIIKYGIEVFCSNEHTLPNDEFKIVKLSLLGKLREKARKTQNSAVEIIKRQTCSLNDNNLSKIPKYSYLNDAIKKAKNKSDTFIPHMKQENYRYNRGHCRVFFTESVILHLKKRF
jgi:hypothetical protein